MRSRRSKPVGAPFAAGPHCTTTSAESAPSVAPELPGIPGAAAQRALAAEVVDLHPADVVAPRAAGVLGDEAARGRLRIAAAAAQAANRLGDGAHTRAEPTGTSDLRSATT